MKTSLFFAVILSIFNLSTSFAQKQNDNKKEDNYSIRSSDLQCFKFRSIGPAMISGRVIDIAVNPNNHSEYFVASASGGLWKTADGGITFDPAFDGERPYSIGCVAYSNKNTNIIWLGSGENNSQRSVSRGDGVYKSLDGGKSWKNMGLKSSEHIGKILIDPEDENTVFIAAQGPLWNSGGDRGLYKTIDGGATWQKVLNISENTGVSDLAMDLRNHNIIYATSYQRRRHIFTLIDGGPESAIYKSFDGGKTWKKLESGLPKGDVGRIGIALSPVNPNKIYAIIEAQEDNGGIYYSGDGGESWQKMSSYVSTSPQYYNELIADPKNENTIYSMDTYSRYSEDGGKTWTRFSNKSKHVDDHALWVDPSDTKHLLNGCDGGVYESFNRGETWDFKSNIPLSQFYRVSVDNDLPFYFVYGGTQDNNSVYGPSRTISSNGIVNSDWKITHGGDGFETVIDPEDPNTVYAQSQYGWLVRYNRTTHEELDIRPSEPDNGEAYRWNWDAPVIISPFDHKTLYFAANKLFKSIDQGNSWQVISPDLSRQIDRDKLTIMGKIQSPDAIAKNASTSVYGNIVSLAESPKQKGLLYVGSDDGQISVSADDGANWNKYSTFTNVPDMSYVSCIIASKFDANIAFAAFDNHKKGDYKPYIFKTSDKGKSWISIAANLPADETVYSIAQDFINPNLLFVGTEYGLYFTLDEGKHWVQLNSGLPSIAIRDIDIQTRENDLVLASYGRGFYILDDYSSLRNLENVVDKKDAYIFDVKDALLFNQSSDWGGGRRGHFGDNFFSSDNPEITARFTYYFKEEIKTHKQQRIVEEKAAEKAGKEINYPSFEQLEKEENELESYLLFTIKDASGNVVRKLKAAISKGLNSIQWDMHFPGIYPVSKGGNRNNFGNENSGAPVLPGTYSVEMAKVVAGVITNIGNKQNFKVKRLTLDEGAQSKMDGKFYKEVSELLRNYQILSREIDYLNKKIDLIIIALKATPESNPDDLLKAFSVKRNLDSVNIIMNGDALKQSRNAAYAPGLNERMDKIVWGIWSSSEGPTQTHRDDYAIIQKRGKDISKFVEKLKNNEMQYFDAALDKINAPYTPGRKSQF
ncbi:MAG: hypothetical protein AUJ98_04800 [Bacteroidetes bacterium CG2_30_33_31]|nr:MAG: hypothetical protein AUJ98_04800 [Bacteroidetes bacterium CG2_30_33_31]